MHLDAEIDVPQLGRVVVDIAWGGMFYVIADAQKLGIELSSENGGEIARVSEMLRVATCEQLPVVHLKMIRLWGLRSLKSPVHQHILMRVVKML